MIPTLSIAAFGALGALSRYGLQRLAASIGVGSTLGINVVGSFFIGFIAVGIERGGLSHALSLGIAVGFLGGFTTFSTYSLESLTLLSKKQLALFGVYFLGSPALGLLGAWCGVQVGRSWWKLVA